MAVLDSSDRKVEITHTVEELEGLIPSAEVAAGLESGAEACGEIGVRTRRLRARR
jgi:hypothetical protein|tara:strand:+ start:554 stop:718 length:165 start_codon:yes stop_codon:yes gene_type:complete